jgi:hypothetical protein
MNISGTWFFKEEFETGVSTGTAKIFQQDDLLSGEISMTLNIKDETPLHLIQTLEGIVIDSKIVLKGSSYRIVNGGNSESEYSLDNWEGTLNSEGKIIGCSIDLQGICGVFTMERKK